MRPPVQDLLHSLQRCIRQRDTTEALRLHACLDKHGLLSHPILGNLLVSALAQSGCVPLARQAFDQLNAPSAPCLNSLIIAYVKHGVPHQALALHRRMQIHSDFHPSIHAHVALLKACGSLQDLSCGCELHTEAARRGLLSTNCFIGSALVDMYAKCGCLKAAQEVFSGLQERNIVCWTALITAYADNGHAEKALYYFDEMAVGEVPLDAVTLVCALKACAGLHDINRGQVIHSEIIKRGFEKDVVVGGALVVMYSRGGCVSTARDVFDRLIDRDVVLWSTLIAAYGEAGLGEEALKCYASMNCESVSPDQVTFVSVLKACNSIIDICEVHMEITKRGIEDDLFVSNTLIDEYVSYGWLVDGNSLLNKSVNRTVVSWNALLTGYIECGHCEKVFDCFAGMLLNNIAPDSVTYICALKACSATRNLSNGYKLHGEIVKKGLESDAAIGSSLIDLYGKCGYLVDAHALFDSFMTQDTVLWNALITGYADHGSGHEAIRCLEDMRERGVALQVVTFIGGLRACGTMKAVNEGQKIHTELVIMGFETSTLLAGSLIDMYLKCYLLEEAKNILNELPVKDVVLWNILLVGFVDRDGCMEVLEHFRQMQQEGICPDHVSYLCSLKACSSLGNIKKGYALHSDIVRKGWEVELFVGNSLVDMYISCGMLLEAQKCFASRQTQSVASWNALIVGYAEHSYESEALNCFERMQSEGIVVDPITLISSLKACSLGGFIGKVQRIHVQATVKGFDTNVLVGNMLVDTYAKCGLQKDAVNVFDKILDKTVASWNAFIAGKMEVGSYEDALSCAEKMEIEATPFDDLTFICCLRACGSIGAIFMGQKFHEEVVQTGLEVDIFIGNTLIDMYSKCGLLEEALYLCNKLSSQTVYSWNAIVTGYSQKGESEKVFWNFFRMAADGIDPNSVTFVGILNACNHAGDTGSCHAYYELMISQYSIFPTLHHLTCVVDLLGRVGRIDWAVAMVHDLPFHPGLVIWHTILAACRKLCDVELGCRAFEYALQLNELNPATYVCMSNIYADMDAEQYISEEYHMGLCQSSMQ